MVKLMIASVLAGLGISTAEANVQHHFIKNGDISIYTTIYVRENSETVILLHGGPGVPDPMREVATELNKKFQVVTFEQRGTGKSTCNNCSFSIEEYLSDIDAIAAYLKLDSFHLFGYSWGGLYAQIYAQENPSGIKSLFLCSPGSGTNKTWKTTEKEVMRFNKRIASKGEWVKMGWNSLLGTLGSERAYRKLFKQVLMNYNKGYKGVSSGDEQLLSIRAKPINKTRKNIIAYKELSKTDNPDFTIAITYGEKDIYGESKKKVIDRFPTAQIIEIEQSGHIPWIHNPKRFNRILDEFYEI